VPYQPSRFLPIAKDGVKDGDFAMIIGFPGGTSRYASSYQMDDIINYSYPIRIALFRDILGIIDEVSKDNPETAIRLKTRVQGYNNGLKNLTARSLRRDMPAYWPVLIVSTARSDLHAIGIMV